MSVTEIESAIQQLSPEDLHKLNCWLEEYMAERWDREIEEDLQAGHFDQILRTVDEEDEAGLSRPL